MNGPESEIRGGFSSTGKCTIGATWQFLIGVSVRKKHTFLKKKTCERHCHISLISVSRKLSVHKIPSVVYRSEAENFRGLLPDVSGRKPCKQTSSSSNANIYWSTVRQNLRKNGKKGNLARAGRERFESQR